MKNKKLYPFLLSFMAAILLSCGWYIYPFFSFLGFVPILLLNEYFSDKNFKRRDLAFFYYTYIAFLLWNVEVSWWILNSTLIGSLAAYFINSLLMCLPVLLFRFTKNIFAQKIPILDSNFWLLPYWIAFEYLHFNWDLTWTWLHLGNCFAFAHYFVQWYEFTGILGGTIWILSLNILIFNVIKGNSSQNTFKKFLYPSLLLIIPCVLSALIYFNYNESGIETEIVVVQPNIDPYNEKFPGTPHFIPVDQQLQRLINLSESKITSETKFVAWPETSLPVGFDEDLIEDQIHIKKLREFIKRHPGITLITGGDTYKIYLSQYDATVSARFGEGVGYYDYFNSALKVEENNKILIYHKSKLVPGVEQMPYPALFKWIEAYSINMGGISGSLGTQMERTVFYNSDKIGAAPVICYESIFGEYVGTYVKNGAHFIFIITNDGWWGNTPGHVQHLAYARLRAIESRRSIARAANTGISGFLNQKGDIIKRNTYWVQDAINGKIKANTDLTFYTKYGDYLGVFAVYIALITMFISMILLVLKKVNRLRSN